MNNVENESLELTGEMIQRNDEIDNATYQYVLTLTEKTEAELPWNMEIIGMITDTVKNLLYDRFDLTVRHPGVVTNTDGSQFYEE